MQKTAVFELLKREVDDATEKLIQYKLNPWVFFNSKGIDITDHYGKHLSISGVEYSGSAVEVFWGGYIDKFIEELVFTLVDRARKICADHGISPKKPLRELGDLLSEAVSKVYNRMADIDKRLRGKGYPAKIKLRDVSSEIERETKFIQNRIDSEIMLLKGGDHLREFFRGNWKWIVSTLIAILAIVLKLIFG
jgi:hypothetical protein